MFDRYLLVSDIKRIQSKVGISKITCSSTFIPSYNISFDDDAYVIANYQTKELQQFKFGLKGVGDDIKYFIRAEGKRNKNDDRKYSGSNAIFMMPGFNRIIRSQRCLVLADAFVVRMEENAPQLIYMRDRQRPFAFAGLWNRIMSEISNEPELSFAIISTVSNSLLAGFGLKRMPVILDNQTYNGWMNPLTSLGEVLSMLYPYPTDKMNAYPISPIIADKTLNEKSLVTPIDKPLHDENGGDEIINWGRRRKNNSSTGKPTLGERSSGSG